MHSIRKNILLEYYEACIFLIICILYIPIINIYGFNHYLSIIKIKKIEQYKQLPNFSRPTSYNKNKFIDFATKNYKKRIIILNPKFYIDKNKKNNKGKLIEKKIQIGKLIFHLN